MPEGNMVQTSFPPRPKRLAEIKSTIGVLNSLWDGKCAYYLSSPITSGKRYIDVESKDKKKSTPSVLSEEKRRKLVDLGRDQTRPLVRRLRKELASNVIDPTAVADVIGWSQDDYRVLWGSIIERFVHTVIFANDWHYSLGCSYEFLIARQYGANTLTENLNDITLKRGQDLIREAANELRLSGENIEFHEAILLELKDLSKENDESL